MKQPILLFTLILLLTACIRSTSEVPKPDAAAPPSTTNTTSNTTVSFNALPPQVVVVRAKFHVDLDEVAAVAGIVNAGRTIKPNAFVDVYLNQQSFNLVYALDQQQEVVALDYVSEAKPDIDFNARRSALAFVLADPFISAIEPSSWASQGKKLESRIVGLIEGHSDFARLRANFLRSKRIINDPLNSRLAQGIAQTVYETLRTELALAPTMPVNPPTDATNTTGSHCPHSCLAQHRPPTLAPRSGGDH
jgi:hypothetical protein